MFHLDSISDIGVRRKDNQDSYWSALAMVDDTETGILCVCDGMGGLENGALASRIAVEAISNAFKSGVDFSKISNVISEANQKIYDIGQDEDVKMGTTCTVIQVCEGKWEIFHVGDSRCYKIGRDGSMKLLTIDHSAVKQLGITAKSDPIKYKKYKNSLTRCLGIKEEVKADHYKGSYDRGDSFVVCSDGMWHLFEKDVFRGGVEFDNLNRLVEKCIKYGETDNITCTVIRS
jgi:protein phosphatase